MNKVEQLFFRQILDDVLNIKYTVTEKCDKETQMYRIGEHSFVIISCDKNGKVLKASCKTHKTYSFFRKDENGKKEDTTIYAKALSKTCISRMKYEKSR